MNNTTQTFFNETEHNYKTYKEGDRNLEIINSLSPNKRVLSLGCGAGREVEELVKRDHTVVAIDFSKRMIDSSQRIEPNAEYSCVEACEFVKGYNGKKFDYILGLFSFLNYIKKEDRKDLIKNLYNLLNPKGEMIFEIRRVTDRWQDVVKCLFYYPASDEFRDIYTDSFSHHFTKGQLGVLLRPFVYEIDDNIVRITKHL